MTSPTTSGSAAVARAIDGILTAVAGSLGLYALWQMLHFDHGRDQGIFSVVATEILHGAAPYREVWEFKPPGIFLLYVLARAFGPSVWAIRAFEAIVMLSGAVAQVALARRALGDWRSGVFAASLATLAVVELGFWHTAQAESFGAVLVLWAIVCATTERSGPAQRRFWLAAGAFYGFASLLKPTLAAGLIVSAYFAARAEKAGEHARETLRRPMAAAVWMVAGSAGVLTLAALYLGAVGAFGACYHALFVWTRHYVALSNAKGLLVGDTLKAIEQFLFRFNALTPLGLALALGLGARSERERHTTTHVLSVAALSLFTVAIQGKFFPYHYGTALYFTGTIGGWGLWKLSRVSVLRGVPLGALLLVAAVGGLLNPKRERPAMDNQFWRWTETRHRPRAPVVSNPALDSYDVAGLNATGRWLAANTQPSDRVFIWGFEPEVYDRAQRRPASRFVHNIPQRVSWERAWATETLLRDLVASAPAVVLVEHGDVFPGLTDPPGDSASALATQPELLHWLAAGYSPAGRVWRFDVFRRRPSGHP